VVTATGGFGPKVDYPAGVGVVVIRLGQ